MKYCVHCGAPSYSSSYCDPCNTDSCLALDEDGNTYCTRADKVDYGDTVVWTDADGYSVTQEDVNIANEMQLADPPSREEILKCVNDQAWQEFRKSLKGLSTAEKLRKLRSYRSSHSGRCAKVRVENYLNALRRGGQLPPKGR